MKRSKKIVLVLMASASIAACGSDSSDSQNTRREEYATKEDCMNDWGDPDRCERQSTGYYYGPHYYFFGGHAYYFRTGSYDPVPVEGRTNFGRLSPGMKSTHSIHTITSSHIARGGFGSSGHLRSGG
ncbi:MAG: hypothetical protein HQK58_02185 [Deltaproteobacteria bacterium]|nr:hypothetical protein [Deltaproteobacteria bacterium]